MSSENERHPLVSLRGNENAGNENAGNESDCRRIEPLLDDLVDGQLTAAEQRHVEQHLAGSEGVAGCAACGSRLASLEQLLAQVDSLPRSIPPESDLWPGLAPRLTVRARRATAGVWRHRLRQVAAAVAFMTLGGALSQILLPAWRGGVGEPAVAAGAVDDGIDRRKADFALAEADFLRAKEALWAAVYISHDAASPATREVVERNLAVIAGAISELRAALEADPGNGQLEGLLLARHRSEIDLLQRLARATGSNV